MIQFHCAHALARWLKAWRVLCVILCLGLCLFQTGSVLAIPFPTPKPGDIYIWDATSFNCSFIGPVWCASNTFVNNARHFYLTNANFATNQVLTACTSGYHTASLWEILNVSKLVYDYDQPSARLQADSGWGPPSFWYGWVRTGGKSSGDRTTGTGNCLNWSNTSSTYYGVSVRLSRTWDMALRGFIPSVFK